MTNCACECHRGKNVYHVLWKACCASPVDGGKPKKVYGCAFKDGKVRFLIADSKEDVAPYWRAAGFGSERGPIEDSVAEVEKPPRPGKD